MTEEPLYIFCLHESIPDESERKLITSLFFKLTVETKTTVRTMRKMMLLYNKNTIDNKFTHKFFLLYSGKFL